MKKESLNTIKDVYQKGGNIIQYLKDIGGLKNNTDEIIMISYDLQSGSYIKYIRDNSEYNNKYTLAISKIINKIDIEWESILEVGVGEATTLANLIPKLKNIPSKIYGFDLAWSRIRYAVEYMKKKEIMNPFLFMGDLFNIPLANNSIDIVYTSHSIEPNGGREKKALLELIRVTKKYLILLEPAYEFASAEAKRKMENHGYIKNLYSTALSLGLKVIEHRLFDVCSNPLNPTGLLLIQKEPKNDKIVHNPLICPITKTPLELIRNSLFTKEGLLVYPIIDGIPCLLKESAIIATHYLSNFDSI